MKLEINEFYCFERQGVGQVKEKVTIYDCDMLRVHFVFSDFINFFNVSKPIKARPISSQESLRQALCIMQNSRYKQTKIRFIDLKRQHEKALNSCSLGSITAVAIDCVERMKKHIYTENETLKDILNKAITLIAQEYSVAFNIPFDESKKIVQTHALQQKNFLS